MITKRLISGPADCEPGLLKLAFVTLESDSVELPHWQDIVQHDGSFYKGGYLEMPNKPGLGIELNDEVCRRYLAEGSGYFEYAPVLVRSSLLVLAGFEQV